ncbi:MAG: FGGY-family carbohydrate kinase [Clostridia bacterium]
MSGLVLSFDCGTQSVRAMLFNDKGELLGKVKECFTPYFSEKEGYAEQHADYYWQMMCVASNKLKSEMNELWDSVQGVSVTTMRDVGVCVDKDIKPLRPAILWLDRRKASCKEKMPLASRILFSVSGMKDVVAKNRKDCKSNWIRENQPEIWEKTHKFLQLSTYLNYCMTGEIKDSVASTIGHIPFDYKKKQWLADNHYQMPVFKIASDMFYPLIEPGEIIGKVTPKAAEELGIKEGLPLIAAGSDKGCETLGTGVIGAETASISFGTTATIQVTTQKYIEPLTFLPAYPAVYPNRYNPEIMINRGYWMLTWFIDQFVKRKGEEKCFERELDKRLFEIPPGAEGLIVEPYWGPVLKKPEARGAIIGFTERHTLLHIYRAMLEGINFGLIEGARCLEKQTKTKIKMLTVSGGGAASDEVCQLTADMFGLPVERVQTYETSGLGAAICAFVGLERFKTYDEAIQNMVHRTSRFESNPANHEIYRNIYENVFRHTYKKLKPIYQRIKN